MTTIRRKHDNLPQPGHTFIDRLLGSLVDLDSRLRHNPPARIADIGCGSGWSSMRMAKAYPRVRVDGFDVNGDLIEDAWVQARQARLTDRITFHARDAGDGVLNGRYDLVTAFECVLDMGNPASVLATMRRLAGENGAVIVAHRREDVALHCHVLESGFSEVELLTVESDRFKFFRLHQ